ncbi:hypothetical protein C3408_23075 [Candidatus Pantoea alvi]|nr:hypothetical protein C3408_23075 [Pantoea alvi]
MYCSPVSASTLSFLVRAWFTCHFGTGQCSLSSRTDVRCGDCALSGTELAATPTALNIGAAVFSRQRLPNLPFRHQAVLVILTY